MIAHHFGHITKIDQKKLVSDLFIMQSKTFITEWCHQDIFSSKQDSICWNICPLSCILQIMTKMGCFALWFGCVSLAPRSTCQASVIWCDPWTYQPPFPILRPSSWMNQNFRTTLGNQNFDNPQLWNVRLREPKPNKKKSIHPSIHPSMMVHLWGQSVDSILQKKP
jgi:hypothetical protein